MISDIMNTHVIILKPKDSVKKALDLMNDNNINGAPVVNEEGNLIGMIVKADIYRFLIEEGHYDTCPVEWVMTKDVFTASKEEDIISIAKKILDKDIIAMPIVDSSNKLLGIVSIEDILKSLICKLE
ncbi:CBS domain-containing protein [Clostridium tepidum]|uniref:CBS domain-containing protein n=1 Tax=Clostridium tepidum TaxID=1962263 RepID=A0A1S9I0Y0_9CLOT|nr:CBS domain-containing protein [Clostridium tepidum]MCR1933497.1 CBS domain-containing protein [Clostridium tepidum]MDU6878105.1 CBS domain-containing protein [Clostridium botulinum]OOO61765.1 CBS domain-containing protein [Clostridium tepidum]OOO63991.1 CBS domain-containing protein [Clostridium tepidum]